MKRIGTGKRNCIHVQLQKVFYSLHTKKSDNKEMRASVHCRRLGTGCARKGWISAGTCRRGYFNDYWPEGTMTETRIFLIK